MSQKSSPYHTVTYLCKWVKTSWIDGKIFIFYADTRFILSVPKPQIKPQIKYRFAVNFGTLGSMCLTLTTSDRKRKRSKRTNLLLL